MNSSEGDELPGTSGKPDIAPGCVGELPPGIEGCARVEPHIHLVRVLFRMSGFLTLPDETTVAFTYPPAEGTVDQFACSAIATVHHVKLTTGLDATISVEAVTELLRVRGNIPARRNEPEHLPELRCGTG